MSWKALLSENSEFRVDSRDYTEWDGTTKENDADCIWHTQVALITIQILIRIFKNINFQLRTNQVKKNIRFESLEKIYVIAFIERI